MFTWVSRRRVTAPLGAALCDDLRRYYAQNNKVDSVDLYVQRRACRSAIHGSRSRCVKSRNLPTAYYPMNPPMLDWIRDPQPGRMPWLIVGLFLRKISLTRERICFLIIDCLEIVLRELIFFFLNIDRKALCYLAREDWKIVVARKLLSLLLRKKSFYFWEVWMWLMNCERMLEAPVISWNLCHFLRSRSSGSCYLCQIQTLQRETCCWLDVGSAILNRKNNDISAK